GLGGERGRALPRIARLHERIARRAASPRHQGDADLRGLLAHPACDHRARSARRGSRRDAMTGSPYWNPKMETLPREDLRRLQLEKLRRIATFAQKNSGFHRRRFEAARFEPSKLKTWDDLRRIPV